MKRLVKGSLLVTSVLLAMGSVAVPAAARGVVAFAGRHVGAANEDCFTVSYGSVQNTCSSTKRFFIPLPIDSTGYKDVWVNVQGAAQSNNVACQAVGVNAEVDWQWGSPIQNIGVFGAPYEIELTGAYVPGMGALYVYCDVNHGGRINSVSFET